MNNPVANVIAMAMTLASIGTAHAQVKAFVGARIIDGTGAAAISDGTLIVEVGA
jgi:hypothetical protein